MEISLLNSSDWYQYQWMNLNKLEQKPWLILWGTKEELITIEYLKKWKKRLPYAKIKKFVCGHFVQEEKTEEAIQEISNFMEN